MNLDDGLGTFTLENVRNSSEQSWKEIVSRETVSPSVGTEWKHNVQIKIKGNFEGYNTNKILREHGTKGKIYDANKKISLINRIAH
jgi:hypothetical protein